MAEPGEQRPGQMDSLYRYSIRLYRLRAAIPELRLKCLFGRSYAGTDVGACAFSKVEFESVPR